MYKHAQICSAISMYKRKYRERRAHIHTPPNTHTLKHTHTHIYIFPLTKIIPQTINPPPPPICRLFSTTGSPLHDQVYHPSGPSNMKCFSSVNITFLKSTCFVNHLLAHTCLTPLCFFVSVIFFLAFAYFKPILCSVLCTVRTFTSNSHFSFTFLVVTFSPGVKSRVTVLFILLSVLLPFDLFRPLFFFRSEFVFSMYSTVDFDSFKSMVILLMLRPSSRFFRAKQTTSFECIYLILPRNIRTIYCC